MRLVSWVLWGFLFSTFATACGDPERNGGGGRGSGGEAAEGSGGSAAGMSGSSGASARGGSGANGGSGGGGGAPTFIDERWGALCTHIMTCAIANDDYIAERELLGTHAGCLAAVRELVGSEPPTRDLLAQIAAGTIRFVPENAAACLAEVAACTRQSDYMSGTACHAVFEGDVPTDGACRRWEECAGDAFCDHANGCPGRCAPRRGPGESCTRDEDCSPGAGIALCDYGTTGGTCKRLSIGVPAPLNGPCTANLFDATELVICADGLWCDVGDGSAPMGTCRQPIADGGACVSADDICVEGDWCFDETQCRPAGIRRQEGDACDDDAFAYCDAIAGLVCVDGVCHPPGDGTSGSPCHPGDYYELVTCADGLACVPTGIESEGICRPLLEADAACQSSLHCASGTCRTTCAPSYCDG